MSRSGDIAPRATYGAGMDKRTREAIKTLSSCVWAGLALGAIGAIAAVLTWPGSEVQFGEVVDTGNGAVAFVGVLFLVAGQMLLTVGLIGYGVKLGREASPIEVTQST